MKKGVTSSLLYACRGHHSQKLGVNLYGCAILVTKATYLPKNGCTTVLYIPLEEAISCGEDRALPAIFSLAFPQPQAQPSLGNSFCSLWSLTGSSSKLCHVSAMLPCTACPPWSRKHLVSP